MAHRGGGVVHSEMFPLLDSEGDNPLELFQIWLNLPAEQKLVDPHFTMLWDDDIPRHVVVDDEGHDASITVIAGSLEGLRPPAPPPDSYASRPDADLAIWHLRFEPGASWVMPAAAGPDTVRGCSTCSTGRRSIVDGHELGSSTGAAVGCDVDVALASPGGVDCLVLQGRPIGEPVAMAGPFVMNDRARDRAGVRRLPTHGVRRLAVADRRPAPRPRPWTVRPTRRRSTREELPRDRRQELTGRAEHLAVAQHRHRARPRSRR